MTCGVERFPGTPAARRLPHGRASVKAGCSLAVALVGRVAGDPQSQRERRQTPLAGRLGAWLGASLPGSTRTAILGMAALLLCAPSFAQTRQLEIGVEGFAYRSSDDAPQPRQRPRPRRLPRPRAPRPRLEGDARLLPRRLPRLRRAGLGDGRRRDRLARPAGLRAVLVGREGGRARREAAHRLGLGLRLEPDQPPRAAEERPQHHARAGGGPRRAPRLGAGRVGERRPRGRHDRRHARATCRWPRPTWSAATRPRSARASS